MKSAFPQFEKPCLEAFQFLVERYGFEEPIIEQLGRECFIRYEKENRIVSIAYEPYSIPIVELFSPTHEMKNRRIPRINSGLGKKDKFDDEDEAQQRKILTHQATELESKELDFLKQ
ncbi:hypothetical protein [Puniceicoccus vermicola]|uniref:Uncharacterized protein n=1 Tax=Puniceicoccus vermicola TaxID=388746 RepID=A0A7X1AV78_9BACT|nr:hypothetical protein [Puniceicoccus vermicola]MBC2600640.1 hypothetical protein [Puniceicoccus vermicola]